jgi:hypothetical protein
MRAAVANITKSNPPPEVASAATAFDAKLAGAGGATGGGRRGGGGGGFGGPGAAGTVPPPPNFAGMNGTINRQLDTLDFGDMAPNEPMQKAYVAVCTGLKTAVTNWNTILKQDLVALNAVLIRSNLKPIEAALPPLAMPLCLLTPPPAAGK